MQGKNGYLHAPVFFIEWNGCVTILTSASLVSDFVVDKKIAENLRVGGTIYSCDPCSFNAPLKTCYTICRLKYCFQIKSAE